MRDFEVEATARSVRPSERDSATPEAGATQPLGQGRSPALNMSTLMHLQRTAGNAGVVQLLAEGEEQQGRDRSPVHDVVGSGGSPLDEGTRATMESAFGQSFEHVRVHTDDRASKSAESVGANAYTVGSDVVFKSGQFNPATPVGQRTIAHELAHVVQQSSGPVDGSDAPGGVRISDPSDRFERAADRTADDVMSSVSSVSSASAQPASSGSSAVAQLEADEQAGAPPVQREEAPEEDEEPAPPD